jgi:hypothetical protein
MHDFGVKRYRTLVWESAFVPRPSGRSESWTNPAERLAEGRLPKQLHPKPYLGMVHTIVRWRLDRNCETILAFSFGCSSTRA